MSNALIRKFEHAGGLDEADHAALRAVSVPARQVEAHQDLSREGDRPETVHLVMEGLAYRYKILPGGKRQIVALLVPGDFCNLHVAILARRDHSTATLVPSRIVEIPRGTIKDLTARLPNLAHAFWWAALVQESILREWLTGLGQRDADHRVAHLFCELLVRLQTVGHATASGYDLPMTQVELADLFGFTPVHANRVLQQLRGRGLIVLKGRRLEIPDLQKLRAFCGFDPGYLHLIPRQPDA